MRDLILRLGFFLVIALTTTVTLNSCRADQSQVLTYFSEEDRDTLLVNIITYMGRPAPGATGTTRFEPKFRAHYVKQLAKYRFDKYRVTADSTHYYFIIRPVGEGNLFRRGVGGKFRLNGNLTPIDFEEMWCTPHFKDDSTLRVRGRFLFAQMVKAGNIDKYLGMKHYVEWPDATLRYDRKLHEWTTRVENNALKPQRATSDI